ncbi:hypothetical protein LJR251_000302 [Rhizobium rhizogenes]|uniref:DUF6941 family protein n=1 Tax=Rhizobium rhizogenes TaxID=359 RepID=UPI003ED06F74
MKLHNLTVCDQVRQEITGKFLLIGVYSNGIIVSELPAQFPITIWGLLEAEKLGRNSFSIRARMANSDQDLLLLEGDADILELDNWTPIGFGGAITLPEEGKLLIEARFDDEKVWTTLRELNCKKAEVSLISMG